MKILFGISSVGAVGCMALGGYILYSEPTLKITKSKYFQEAFRELEDHPVSIKLLGKPIKTGYIKVEPVKENPNIAMHEVQILGSLKKGVMYFTAEKKEEGSDFRIVVHNVELLIDGNDKRLIVKNSKPIL